MGANGSGKTTLMKVLLRLLRPQQGTCGWAATTPACRRPNCIARSAWSFRTRPTSFSRPRSNRTSPSARGTWAARNGGPGAGGGGLGGGRRRAAGRSADPPSEFRPTETRLPGRRAGHAALDPGARRAHRRAGSGSETQTIELLVRLNRRRNITTIAGHALRRPAAGARHADLRAPPGARAPRRAAASKCLADAWRPRRPACGCP